MSKKYRVIGELSNSHFEIVKRYIMRDIETLEPLVNLDLNVADSKIMDLNLMYFTVHDQMVGDANLKLRCKIEPELPEVVPISVDAFILDIKSSKEKMEIKK